MEAGLQRLSGNEMRVAFVPMDQWPKIRHNYLVEHGYLNQGKTGTDKKIHQLSQHQPRQLKLIRWLIRPSKCLAIW